MRCFCSERNEAVPDGEIGEICVKGPILALGYYNSREKTAELPAKPAQPRIR